MSSSKANFINQVIFIKENFSYNANSINQPNFIKENFPTRPIKRVKKTSSYQADQKVCETGLEVEVVSVLGEDYDANEVAWEIMITACNHKIISDSEVDQI